MELEHKGAMKKMFKPCMEVYKGYSTVIRISGLCSWKYFSIVVSRRIAHQQADRKTLGSVWRKGRSKISDFNIIFLVIVRSPCVPSDDSKKHKINKRKFLLRKVCSEDPCWLKVTKHRNARLIQNFLYSTRSVRYTHWNWITARTKFTTKPSEDDISVSCYTDMHNIKTKQQMKAHCYLKDRIWVTESLAMLKVPWDTCRIQEQAMMEMLRECANQAIENTSKSKCIRMVRRLQLPPQFATYSSGKRIACSEVLR